LDAIFNTLVNKEQIYETTGDFNAEEPNLLQKLKKWKNGAYLAKEGNVWTSILGFVAKDLTNKIQIQSWQGMIWLSKM
jgi:hypothetical protein